MTRQAVPVAIPLSPVVRVTAVPDAFPAAGSRQGQWGALIGGAHAGLVWNMIGSPQLLDGLSWHGL